MSCNAQKLVRLFYVFLLLMVNVTSFASAREYCKPEMPCWPKDQQWQMLKEQVGGRLVIPKESTAICTKMPKGKACQQALKDMKNPFFLQTNPGDTQSQGWLNAWQSVASNYAVLAKSSEDVSYAVNFAKKHNLKVAIKGAGHDYLGRNVAKDSLLIWLRPIRKLEYSEAFLPQGAPKGSTPQKAITVGAGERWLNVYNEVTTNHNRFVQGGGCASVGATGGFTQGGGFGSWSKNFGTGAAGVLEFKIVTATGETLIANKHQNNDLFWAVRGGGGGTFGVVTEMTMLTHPLPSHFALVQGEVTLSSQKDYKPLVKEVLSFFSDHLNNQHWGENISFDGEKVTWFLLSQGLSEREIKTLWKRLEKSLSNHKIGHNTKLKVSMIPPNKMWSLTYMKSNFPELVVENKAKGAETGEFWWAPNSAEVSTFWYTYQSWWLPNKAFTKENLDKTVAAFVKASKHHTVAFHIQKGLAGASKQAIRLSQETSTNPKVFEATGLIIMSAGTNGIYANVNDFALDVKKAKKTINKINKAMYAFKKLAPNAGTYANEADYFEPNWQQAFFGKYYPKLLEIKKKYDPASLFSCHHCVGS